jgi:hypothetical protein
MRRIWRLEEIRMMKGLDDSEQGQECYGHAALTSLADIRLLGSYANSLASKLIASVLAAVNRSRNGVLGYCPTNT